jgi:hypothetical protein
MQHEIEVFGNDPPENKNGPHRRGTAWYGLHVSSEVDITLVRETLALTPQQRIRQNDRVLRMIDELRDGLAKSRKPPDDAGVERR